MTDKIPGLSGLVVAHNEEAMLDDAFKSLACCDEIVVVLDRCTDGSKAIAQKYTRNIIEGAWEIEGERRMLGIEACKGPWIFELDADERLTSELIEEMRTTLPQTQTGYFLVPILNYVGSRLVQYGWAGSFGTTAAKKLFHKGSKVWGQQRVHPQVTMKGPEYRLKGGLTHLVDRDIDDMIDRLQRYSRAAAADMRGKPLPPFRKSLRKGLTRFYKSYISRKGYREGRMGFLLALMAALFPILSHIKAELENQ